MIYIGGRGVLQTCEALEAGLRRMLGVGKLVYVRATRARPGLAPCSAPPAPPSSSGQASPFTSCPRLPAFDPGSRDAEWSRDRPVCADCHALTLLTGLHGPDRRSALRLLTV